MTMGAAHVREGAMNKTIRYYFSVNSVFAYLGSQELERIAKRHRAFVNVKPIHLKTVFERTGGVPLAQRAAERQAYRFIEMRRWRDRRGVRLVMQPPYFPAAEEPASHIILASMDVGRKPLRLAHAIMHAQWAEERNIADTPTLLEIAQRNGEDALGLVAKSRAPAIHDQLMANTEEAIRIGCFGSPWYVFNGEPFFGQDRLEFLDRALENASD
jgi:2-hydroxychromene-2-carboxylate isomerase